MYISAGHSETDPGAVAFKRKEADIAVEMRNIVSFYLTRLGRPHELDSTGTNNLPLAATVKSSRKHNTSLEFHCNASESQAATGCEVLCAADDNALAARICAAISNTLGIRNRGVKAENSGQHSRLAFIQAGGMIVELFFITNPRDLAAYDAKKWLLGKAIADVLADAKR